MVRSSGFAVVILLALWSGGCGNLKYQALKGTTIDNPPTSPVNVYVRQFHVTSKAAVIELNAAVGGVDLESQAGRSVAVSEMARAGSGLMEISRPSRIEDLTRSILHELRKEKLRIFTDLEQVVDLQSSRVVSNPFRLVSSESEDAQLEISGEALIRSQRVERKFSQKTRTVEIWVRIKDLATGREVAGQPMKAGIRMVFNSKELEEALAVAVVTYLTQKTLF
ncbi:MAG: hypothetical protein VX733_15275 [Candidatus Latescibacterota bacterium]|nr:hypothetical protein [Candidatus Latescibacterota bacterium]